MCISCSTSHRVHRLPLRDGRRVFVEWHSYFGPSFWRDRACTRELETWYEDEAICAALDWFVSRGKRA